MKFGFAAIAAVLTLAGLSATRVAAETAASPTTAVQTTAASTPAPAPVVAPAPAAASATVDLKTEQQTLTQIQGLLPTVSDDGRLAAMGARALAIEAQANSVVATDGAVIAKIDVALKHDGFGRKRLTTTQKKQQAPLLAQRAPVAAEFGQAQGVAMSASNLFSQIAERRREGFSARVLERSPSPVSPDFWTELSGVAGEDLGRLNVQAYEARITAEGAPEPKAAGALLAARRRNALACRVHALRIRTVVTLLHVGTRSLRGIRTQQTARQQTSTGTYRCATAAIKGCARSGTNCSSQSRTAQGTLTGSLPWRDTIKLTVGILPARSIVASELIEGFSPAREGRETRTRRGHGTGTDKRQCDESG